MNVRHFLFIAVPTAPPGNVHFKIHGSSKLVVSWNEPDKQVWSGQTTRYKICHSTQRRDLRPTCSVTDGLSYEITSLQPSTKYFVTVSAGTSDGFGRKSLEISKITYGGKSLVMTKVLLSLYIRRLYTTQLSWTTVIPIWACSITLARLRIADDLWYYME